MVIRRSRTFTELPGSVAPCFCASEAWMGALAVYEEQVALWGQRRPRVVSNEVVHSWNITRLQDDR